MENPQFFGYGSLVNRNTHAYPAARQAWLRGWRREWFRPNFRALVFLSIRPDPTSEIAGLVAEVPGGDWAALDEREAFYARHQAALRLSNGTAAAEVYAVEPRFRGHFADEQPILLSYLDVVVQGYFREFGAIGVEDFFATTSGWDAPVLNDRADPQYPRAQSLSAAETQLVDGYLARLGSRFLSP